MADRARAQLLLIGTDHLEGWDGLDGRPDVLSPARQAELHVVAERIADRLSPTVVGVEAIPSRQPEVDALLGSSTYTERNELVQLGVRLARRTHARLRAIDADWTLDHEGMTELLARRPELEPATEPSDELRAAMAAMAERRHDPLDRYLVWLATDDAQRHANDREYLTRILPLGARDGWAGLDLVASWYRRNLRIFANLCRQVTPEDRAVVVFGQGHIASLTHVAASSGLFDLVPLAQVLDAGP